MGNLAETEEGWRLSAAGLVLDIDRTTGCLSRVLIRTKKEHVWTPDAGNVTVRDDLLERTFSTRDLKHVACEATRDALHISKRFRGAPWQLQETYRIEQEAVGWEAAVRLDEGEFRSCAVSLHIPWPQPVYPVSFWAAREGMPSAPHRHAGVALEYGEITSGILMPALSCYRADADAGLLLAMPFDFRTPRFRFLSGYREPDLRVEFDWLALAPGRPARASLLLRATEGDWRPALGWLYQRFTEYFEPRSALINRLWGGHICGGSHVSREEAATMAGLGMTWHEIHGHFPAYGNYHPEEIDAWRSGHDRENDALIRVDTIRKTIATLHEAGIAALPYLQVSGDGDKDLLDPDMESSRIRDRQGNHWSAWPGTSLMNSDPALPFGKDIVRQIEGMVRRYPDMDGVFLDQPCYNFLDTAHDDGITAVDNRPAYMTGFNYYPHLERLSSLLHPDKVIIGNGPYGVGILKYIDGFMAEGQSWLCDHLQYYGIGRKPLFFLEYTCDDAQVERMFQQALLYGAGFTSYPAAMPFKDLYDAYRPLLERLYRRRWVFDADPLELPPAFRGNVFQGDTGSLLVSLVGGMIPLSGRGARESSVRVKTASIGGACHAVLHRPGKPSVPLALGREEGAVQFSVPADRGTALVELTGEPQCCSL